MRWQTAGGARAELLDGATARKIEPEISPRVTAAAYFADDAQVEPPRLLRALAAAAMRAGVELRSHVTVERLAIEDGRCVGVALGGEILRADATVLAAGAGRPFVPGVPAELPKVFPARGQMVLLDEKPPRVRSIVFSEGAYAVPRGDGRVVCGSTMEMVGFRREVTAEGVAHHPEQGDLRRPLARPGDDGRELVQFPSVHRGRGAADGQLAAAGIAPGDRASPQRDLAGQGHGGCGGRGLRRCSPRIQMKSRQALVRAMRSRSTMLRQKGTRPRRSEARSITPPTAQRVAEASGARAMVSQVDRSVFVLVR